jgi:hypothetical protein
MMDSGVVILESAGKCGELNRQDAKFAKKTQREEREKE